LEELLLDSKTITHGKVYFAAKGQKISMVVIILESPALLSK